MSETVITELSLDDVRAFLAVATRIGAFDERVLLAAITDWDLDVATWSRLVVATEVLCPETPKPAPVWEPPEPLLALPTYLAPVSTEARYSRSRGRYGRHRGGEADDPAPLNAERSGGNRSALHRAVGVKTTGITYYRQQTNTRRIPRPPLDNQSLTGATR